MSSLPSIAQPFFVGCCVILAILILLVMIRTILGPKIADRIMSINMIGTLVMTMIAVISYLNDESYLLDICLIYAAISFIAVIVLSKVYTERYLADKADEKARREAENKKEEEEKKS